MLKYQLIRGETLLGIVTRDPSESDFPWQVGWLEPSAAYDEVRLLFEAMERILEVDGFNEASGNIHDHIMAPGVVMRSLENGETTDVIGLTIADKRVSWR